MALRRRGRLSPHARYRAVFAKKNAGSRVGSAADGLRVLIAFAHVLSFEGLSDHHPSTNQRDESDNHFMGSASVAENLADRVRRALTSAVAAALTPARQARRRPGAMLPRGRRQSDTVRTTLPVFSPVST